MQRLPCRLQPVRRRWRSRSRAKPVLSFTNTGLYDLDGKGAYPADDRGLMDMTKKPADMGRFRAPTLRNIALTAPYMHDGSIADASTSVIAHYAGGGKGPLKAPQLKGFAISETEAADLVAFLESLTDTTFVVESCLRRPRQEVVNRPGHALVGLQSRHRRGVKARTLHL